MDDEMGNMCSMHGNIKMTTKFYSLNYKVTEQLEGLITGKGLLLKQVSERQHTAVKLNAARLRIKPNGRFL